MHIKALCLLAAALLISSSPARPAFAQNGLDQQVEKLLKDSGIDSDFAGIEIVGTRSQSVLYQRNARSALIPASNMKLITSVAALELLGKDFSHHTTVYGDGKLDSSTGVYTGNLWVKGTGDPNISGRFYNGDVHKVFKDWANALAAKGIRSVQGNLLLDDSDFDTEFFSPLWEGEDPTKWYAAQISALSFNDNCIDITIVPGSKHGSPVSIYASPPTSYVSIENRCKTTTDKRKHLYVIKREPWTNRLIVEGTFYSKNGQAVESVPVHDPTLYFGAVFRETLAVRGITVSGQTGRAASANGYDGMSKLAELVSPLTLTLKPTNKRSQNFYAEQIMKTIGKRIGGAGTWTNGSAAVSKFLATAGAAPDGYTVADGSGLSRSNRLTADTMAKVLWYAYFSDYRIELMESMAIAGEKGGSLEKRLADKPWKVFAKTGYITGSCCFSGFVVGESGEVYIFSILVNRFPCGTDAVKDFQDSVCRALASM